MDITIPKVLELLGNFTRYCTKIWLSLLINWNFVSLKKENRKIVGYKWNLQQNFTVNYYFEVPKSGFFLNGYCVSTFYKGQASLIVGSVQGMFLEIHIRLFTRRFQNIKFERISYENKFFYVVNLIFVIVNKLFISIAY